MDSCNPCKCAKVWPSTTATTYHNNNIYPSRVSTADIDGINSRLNTLSLEERAQGLDDLHGVAATPDETPETLNPKLDEMNAALLSSGNTADTAPYRTALEMDVAYVKRLKIPFLRATMYNSRQAASLMIRFFALKMDLFGEEKLVRDLRLSDLDRPGEMEALREKGMGQLLPRRDRSGRIVFLNLGRVNQQYDIRIVLRLTMYFLMMAYFQQDEETQRKGVVLVYFGFGQTKVPLSRAIAYNSLFRTLPVKIAAQHVCRHDDSNGNLFKVVLKSIGDAILDLNLLCRWRSHVGTQIEVMYNLMSFGIIKEALPLKDDGELDLTNHHRMLDLVQKREEEEDNARNEAGNAGTTTGVALELEEECEGDRGSGNNNNNNNGNKSDPYFVSVPGPMDILMGRGRHPGSMPGALRLSRVIACYGEQYNAGTKFEKQVITDVILKQVKEFGCRFLKERAGGYEEVDDAVARNKISHGFRNARLRTRQKQQLLEETQQPGRKVTKSIKRRVEGSCH